MINVITYGTFDLLHVGHVKFLERAKALGNKLFVGISTDNFNVLKGKQAIYTFEERFEIIKSIKFVDAVFIEDSWEQKEYDIKKFNIDVFVIGEDWKGKFNYLSILCQVIYLSRTKDISTTSTKERIKKLYGFQERLR